MRKLFLASIASVTLEKVTELLPAPADKLKLAFIPTASNLYDDKSWLLKDRDKLVEMGFQVEDLDLENKSKIDLQYALSGVNVVFVSGGNTFYLLEKVQESGFAEVIKPLIDEGVVYIGSSAGSVLVCPTIAAIEGIDDPKDAPNLKTYKGLGVVDFLIFPHYGDPDYQKVYSGILTKWQDKEYEIKLLTNEQALIVNGNQVRIVEK